MTDGRVVSIDLPLPPSTLSKNGRAHYMARHQDFQRVKEDARRLLVSQLATAERWPGALMDMDWRQSGRLCDDDAVVARCAAIRDAAQAANLVADDALVRIGCVTVRRVHKSETGVTVTFRRLEEARE